MIRFVIFACVISFVYAGYLPPMPQVNGRIVGGETAGIKDVPYQVAVLVDYSETGTFVLKCGGVILKENVVLTAAHCTDFENPPMKIRAGSTTHNFGGQLIDVERIKTHDYYNSKLDYDFAVLYLAENLVIDGTNVAIVELTPSNTNLVPGTIVDISGWGATVQGGDTQTSLSKVRLPIVDHGICEAFYSSQNFQVTARMICAGNYANGGPDFCRGDEGGPLIAGTKLVGIASYHSGCGRPNYPGVYAYIVPVLDWIERMLED